MPVIVVTGQRQMQGPVGIGTTPVSGVSLAVSSGVRANDGTTAAMGFGFVTEPELGMYRVRADTVQVGNGSIGLTVDGANGVIYPTAAMLLPVQTAQAARWRQASASELLTIAAAATTDTSANLLPANSIIEAVVVRVVTVIPTAATFTVGDPTTPARFATGIATAADTTGIGILHCDQSGAGGPKQATAAKIRITPNVQPAAATGQVRITVFYRTFDAPYS